jgi:dTDP-4-dehydrorhamnose reductase
MMRVLILGGAGMLGHKLCQCFRQRFETWTTVLFGPETLLPYDVVDPDKLISGVDIMDFDAVIRVIARIHPHAVVNGIGIIKQLKAAQDPLVSVAVNSLFPHRLAELCRACGVRLIHMSTDCVFTGRRGSYSENDVSDAEDLYGRTKYLGEVGGPGCLTVRTSIIGRELNTANGLIEWFLSNRGKEVRGYRRAIYSGLTTTALAQIFIGILEKHPQLEGLYQVSSDPITKYDLLSLVNQEFQTHTTIEPDEEHCCNHSLDSSRFRAATGIVPPAWPEMIRDLALDPTPYQQWRMP